MILNGPGEGVEPRNPDDCRPTPPISNPVDVRETLKFLAILAPVMGVFIWLVS